MRELITQPESAAGRVVRQGRGELRHPGRGRTKGARPVDGGAERSGDAQAAPQSHLRRHPDAQPRRVEPAARGAAAGSEVADPQRPAALRDDPARRAGDRRAAAPLLRARRGRDAADGAARDRRHARPARIDDLARDDAEVHADAARHVRAQVFLRQPRRHRHRRRRVGHRDPRADQAADRRREPEDAADRQPDRGAAGRAGHHRRPPHRSPSTGRRCRFLPSTCARRCERRWPAFATARVASTGGEPDEPEPHRPSPGHHARDPRLRRGQARSRDAAFRPRDRRQRRAVGGQAATEGRSQRARARQGHPRRERSSPTCTPRSTRSPTSSTGRC